jgi:photosystem II stability/assembly factor-like uncharacterized protein
MLLAVGAHAQWHPVGPFGGAAEVVRADPNHYGTVLAATRDGLLYRSTDSGASWTHLAFPAELSGTLHVLEIDRRRPGVWYVGIESDIAWNSGLYRTVDGGASWTQQDVPATADLVNGISCPSTTTCEAVGYGSGALRTSDGGTAWVPQALPSSVQELSGVSCYSLTHCVAVGIDSIHAGRREVGVLVSTQDGGVTWIRRHIPTGVDDLTSVACTASGVCEAVGLGSTAIIGSTDGGRTWAAQVVPGSPYLLSVACQGRRTCQAVGQDVNGDIAVFRTTDGGAKWYRQRVP